MAGESYTKVAESNPDRDEFIQWFCSLTDEEQDQVEKAVKEVVITHEVPA